MSHITITAVSLAIENHSLSHDAFDFPLEFPPPFSHPSVPQLHIDQARG